MVQPNQIDQKRLEALGPAERVIHALTAYTDHAVHNRPGFVVKSTDAVGVRWEPVTWKLEGAEGAPKVKNAYKLTQVGKKKTKTLIGVLGEDGIIRNGTTVVGEYRKPGLFPEVVTWMYRQIADVFKMDNDFVAHLASWSFPKEHRDLKCVLAAFMLVQNRCGDPVVENGVVQFHDEDYRDVGEAMCLLRAAKTDLSPKLLLRVSEILELPGVAAINREMGFAKSAREPAMGRYKKTVTKWLRNRELNQKSLDGLIKAGFRTTVMDLCRKVGYKPESPAFFAALRWKQKQSDDGRRLLAIGAEVKAAETWEGLSEKEICEKIISTKPNYKRLVGLLPASVGLTRAVVAAAVDAGCLSDTDLIILTPTLEELGLLTVPSVTTRWKAACEKAENQRAANIAKRVKSTEVAEVLQASADTATAKAMEAVTKDLRVYVVVDKSGSMQASLEAAKSHLTKMLVGFPLTRLHVSVFNTFGTVLNIQAASKAGVEQAFRGHAASGGTDHSSGVLALKDLRPAETEDVLFVFVGDEGQGGDGGIVAAMRQAKFSPVAFGLLKVAGENGYCVSVAAAQMGIPCFKIDEGIFNDPYAVTRTLRNLIASTPVGQARTLYATPAAPVRKTLVQEILETPTLVKPAWASVAA